MAKYILLMIVIITTLCTSCVEKIDNRLLDQENLTIEGLITDQPGPYFVRVTLNTTIRSQNDSKNNPNANVTVVITDDQGNVDVLEPFFDLQKSDTTALYYALRELTGVGFSPFSVDEDRLFRTTSIQGVPGRTYTLTVIHNGQEYKAQALMPPSPPALQARFAIRPLGDVMFGQVNYYVPQVSFKEPQDEDNYYMFFLSMKDQPKYEHNNLWTTFSRVLLTFDDRLMEAEVKDFDIIKTTDNQFLNYKVLYTEWVIDNSDCTNPRFEHPKNNPLQIEMHSIGKAAFDYYESLHQQRENDGGAYSTAPASPPTNFSNGALGFFRASGVSKTILKYPIK